ncbi:MAG: hypothetical protein JSU83_08655 [Deltaproteobacteria bacterium]|nr:MAG: hypothetical protein JSU83_08655 [Deltaproteobacteria bacterium]
MKIKGKIIIKRLFVLIVFFIICNQHFVGARMNMLSTAEVIIHHAPSLINAAQETAELYKESKAVLEQIFGWQYEEKAIVVIAKNNNEFRRITGYSYIVALAVPQRDLIIIDYSKMSRWPSFLERTLKHEICHLMLHHHIRDGQLPKWLDEGIAQWVSDGMVELLMNSKRQSLDDAILAGNYMPLSELTHSFPRDRRSLWLAYEESKSVVGYIEKHYGRKGVLNLLNHLKAGQDFDTALYKSFSISFNELESKWQRQLKNRTRLITFLATYIYEVLFVLAAILTIAGFIRFLIKKRAYKDEDDDGG